MEGAGKYFSHKSTEVHVQKPQSKLILHSAMHNKILIFILIAELVLGIFKFL